LIGRRRWPRPLSRQEQAAGLRWGCEFTNFGSAGRALAAEELVALVAGYSPGMNEASAQKVLEKLLLGCHRAKKECNRPRLGRR
jgi:hypothetical protein